MGPTIPDLVVLKNVRFMARAGITLAGLAALGALASSPAAAGPARTTCVLEVKAACAGVRLRERAVYHGDLRRANFRKADLRGADFRNADLRGADFR
ncbi:MAG: pentapeptide repeat-containing protein, partial [Miltoncostaeaceae bacterium]